MKKCIAGFGLLAVACSAIAADEIKLSAEQVKSLGIATAAPVADREAPVSALTATVVVPRRPDARRQRAARGAGRNAVLSGRRVREARATTGAPAEPATSRNRARLSASRNATRAGQGEPQARPAVVRRRHHRGEPFPRDAGCASGRGRHAGRAATGVAPRRPVRRRARRAAGQAEGRQHADFVRARGRRDPRADGDRGATRRGGRPDLQARAARPVVARDPGACESHCGPQGGRGGDSTAPGSSRQAHCRRPQRRPRQPNRHAAGFRLRATPRTCGRASA